MKGFRRVFSAFSTVLLFGLACGFILVGQAATWCWATYRSARERFRRMAQKLIHRAARALIRPDIAVHVRKDRRIAMRHVRRQRPVITPRWRMCPST